MEFEFRLDRLPDVAKKLARKINGGDIIAFSGPLAAGKTTVIAAIVSALGYHGHVASPTFVIERRYPLQGKISQIVHLDFYRLTAEQASTLDWLDTADEPGTVTVIEWPERVADQLPARTKQIKLEIKDEKTRRLTFSENPTH